MQNIEPTLATIEDYNGKESKEKRMTIQIVILSGLLMGVMYGLIKVNSSVSDELPVQTNIIKY